MTKTKNIIFFIFTPSVFNYSIIQESIIFRIMKEAFILGIFGGLIGIPLAVLFMLAINNLPIMEDMALVTMNFPTYIRAIVVALLLGAIGGIYPSWRATKMLPVEALRYE